MKYFDYVKKAISEKTFTVQDSYCWEHVFSIDIENIDIRYEKVLDDSWCFSEGILITIKGFRLINNKDMYKKSYHMHNADLIKVRLYQQLNAFVDIFKTDKHVTIKFKGTWSADTFIENL